MITHNRQRGLSLIELMVAMVIGLFLVAGVLRIFSGNSQTYHYNQAQISQAENNRISARLLNSLLPQAGHSTISTESILGKNVAFGEETEAKVYSEFENTSITFQAGQVILGKGGTNTVTSTVVYSTDGEKKEGYRRDEIMIRYLAGDGIMTCTGQELLEDDAFDLRQRVERLYIDTNLNLVCEGITKNVKDAVETLSAFEQEIVLGDVNAARASQIRVLGMEISYGLDTDGDFSVDRYVGDMGSYITAESDDLAWNKINSAIIKLTVQTGTRNPQTITHAIPFNNMISSSNGAFDE